MNKILEKHSKIIRAGPEGPRIVKPDFLDLYPRFLESESCKHIDKLYKKDDADAIKQILFVSFVKTRSSSGLIKPYDPSTYSVDCLVSLSKFFSTFNRFFKVKRLADFRFAYSCSEIKTGNNKFINAFAFPNITLCYLAKHTDLDRLLSSVRGSLYKDFPDVLKVDGRTYRPDNLHSIPIYQWFYIANNSGVSFYAKRVGKNELALRCEFDIPFVLPLGKYSESSMRSLLIRYLKNINFGV